MYRKILVAALGTGLAVSLAACGSDSSDSASGASGGVPSEYQELYDAAKASGSTITLYSPGAGELKPVFDEFSKTFPGLTVSPVRLVGVDMLTRLQNEVTSNKHVGDLVLDSTASPALSADAMAWYEPYMPDAAKELPKAALDPNGKWFAPYFGVYGLAYNTQNVEGDDIPDTWDDLTDELWKDKIAMGDPSTPSAASVAIAAAHYNKLVDADWDDQVAANDPEILAQGPEVGQRLTTGASDVGIFPLNFTQTLQDSNAPVEFAAGTSIMDPLAGLVVKDAPNTDGAKLLLSWLLSDDAQKLLAKRGVIPSEEGAPLPAVFDGKMPEQYGTPTSFEENFALIKRVNATWAGLLD